MKDFDQMTETERINFMFLLRSYQSRWYFVPYAIASAIVYTAHWELWIDVTSALMFVVSVYFLVCASCYTAKYLHPVEK